MDRSLLERMTGATLLVILLVVLAPALLDGRQSPGSEAESSSPDVMRAPEQNAPLRVATIRLNGSAAETAAPAPPVARPAIEPAAKPTPVVVQAPAKVTAPAVQAPVVGQWMVQLGSFSTQKNADDYAGQVKSARRQ